MNSLVIWSLFLIMGNLLDYKTTYRGMENTAPEDMNKKELNPILAPFIHKKKFILILKFSAVAAIIALAYHGSGLLWLQLVTVWIFIVVLNNIYAVYAHSKGVLSPGQLLIDKLKFPKFLAFIVLNGFYGFISYGILKLVGLA